MITASKSLVAMVHTPQPQDRLLLESIKQSRRATFILALGGTEVSDIAGMSAAGADASAIRHTPARDARALMGALRAGETLPVSPAGVTSPVVLTRAALSFCSHSKLIVDCGSFLPADTGEEILAGPARSLESGQAQSLETVENLFRAGQRRAHKLEQEELVVLAECVPGGTTTALAVLLALGFPAENLLSGSHPRPNHESKLSLVKKGLSAASQHLNKPRQYLERHPLLAVAALGDPMQAYAMGFTTERSKQGKLTVLGGGSQMLAVYALCSRLQGGLSHTLVTTTKWVAEDPHGDTKALAALIGAPYAASFPNFVSSRHPGLKAYEAGNVKEGVGAGAAMALAHLMMGVDEATLLHVIDSYYEALT